MATIIRPELSKRNKYWIDRRRYYELKYFCLQYPLWQRVYDLTDGLHVCRHDLTGVLGSKALRDPTYECAEKAILYLERMRLIENAAQKTDPELSEYILKAVTEGLTYEFCRTRLDIPCSRETYYDRYRKFFWILDSLKEV